jgi:Outer membrane protein beta-barrel domain
MANYPYYPGFKNVKKLISWLSALIMAMVIAPAVQGQASYTASQPLRLQGFATFSYVNPAFEYSRAGDGNNFGITLGGDLDVNIPTWFKPGLDVRATRATGDQTDQYTYGGGPRVIFPLSHVQPYVDFLISGGKINIKNSNDPDYRKNRSTVYSFGGGADLLLTHQLAIKVDVQSQRWRLTSKGEPFYPLLVSVGLRYEIGSGGRGPR